MQVMSVPANRWSFLGSLYREMPFYSNGTLPEFSTRTDNAIKLLGLRDAMFANCYEFKMGTQITCAACGQRLRITGDRVECWRNSEGRLFCNEFCADDAEEAEFQSRRLKR